MRWQYLIINILLGRGNMHHCQAMGNMNSLALKCTPVMRGKVKTGYIPLTGHIKAGHVTN